MSNFKKKKNLKISSGEVNTTDLESSNESNLQPGSPRDFLQILRLLEKNEITEIDLSGKLGNPDDLERLMTLFLKNSSCLTLNLSSKFLFFFCSAFKEDFGIDNNFNEAEIQLIAQGIQENHYLETLLLDSKFEK